MKYYKHITLFSLLSIFVFYAIFTNIEAQDNKNKNQSRAKQSVQTKRLSTLRNRFKEISSNLKKTVTKKNTVEKRNRYKNVRKLNDGIGEMTRILDKNMERLRLMEKDNNLTKDPVMTRETERLRERLDRMANTIDEMVESMEQIQTRLNDNGISDSRRN